MTDRSIAVALYAVLSADSFVEAIAIATNHSGDSDSTASITGQIWGAMKELAASRSGASCRCAYLIVVAACVCPSSLPTT